MWKLYKEGQGKWSRGLLAFAVALTGLFAVVSIHEALPVAETLSIPLIKDYRFLIEGPFLIGVAILGFWLFNHPSLADFLVDTENELKTKVTWPSKKEEINASLVVVVTVVIIGLFILGIDSLLQVIQKAVFKSS